MLKARILFEEDDSDSERATSDPPDAGKEFEEWTREQDKDKGKQICNRLKSSQIPCTLLN